MAAVISVIATANGKETDGSPVVFSFSRTGDTNTALSVSYQLFGTAQAGSDYTGNTTGTINFAAGSSSATLSLPALADGALIDPYETIIARINPGANYGITPGKQFATATITAEGMVVIPKGISSPGRSSGELRNGFAFAALRSDGSVVSWGGGSYGGVAPTGITGFSQIFSTGFAFAALKSDGSVICWGDKDRGGVAPAGLAGVSQIFSTDGAFAAIKSDGSVVSWGGGGAANAPAGLTGVSQIFSTDGAFAAIKSDGSVICWGDKDRGGVAPAGLAGVSQIFSNGYAFAALKNDGSVVSWGFSSYGGSSPAGLKGVSQIFSTDQAFAALKNDGSVVSWGNDYSGGSAPAGLAGVSQIFCNDYAFAALKIDGSVVSWGSSSDGGNAPAGLKGVTQIFSTNRAFAALKSDGSVVCWSDYGGVAPVGLTGVSQIFSTKSAFAALKSDGSVISWGNGITNSETPAGLRSVVGFANAYTDDRLVLAAHLPAVTASVISVIATANGKETDGSPAVFSFSRIGDTNTELNVSYQLFGTAKAGSDYSGNTTGTVSFAAGSSTATLSLPALADGALIDPYETIIARINPATNYGIETGKQFATATITAEGMVVIPNGANYPGTSNRESRHGYAFAALKSDGSVVSWGTRGTPTELTNVTQIFSNGSAFAALKNDGRVVSWGDNGHVLGPAWLTGVSQIFSNPYAFAALKSDGSVISWGNYLDGSKYTEFDAPAGLTGVTQIFSTGYVFTALKSDGSVVSWGRDGSVGITPVGLTGVVQIFSTGSAFAALKSDGSVMCWGNKDYGGVAPAGLTGVSQIFSNGGAFTALKRDGSVVCWGVKDYGGIAPEGLTGVSQIFSTDQAFAALKNDGSVVSWGRYSDESKYAEFIAPVLTGVSQIFSNGSAFTALKNDGSVVSWGNRERGGNVPAGLTGVSHIFSNNGAFAALKSDGSVISWGKYWDGSKYAEFVAPAGLTGVSQIFSTNFAFVALKSDGSVISWGSRDHGGVAPAGLTGVVGFANPYTDDRLVIVATPTYTLNPSSTTTNEGAILTNTVTTTNVDTGTKFYYALSGNGITTADFSAGALAGEGSTDATGKFTFTHTLANDVITEGAETLSIKLYSDTARTVQVGVTATVSVVDSSTTPAPTYTLTPSATTINEGAVLTSTVNTTNVATGTKLYYALSGTGITTADFSAGALTGEGITDATGKFAFTHTLANDLTTEGAESLAIKLFPDEARSTQVGETATVSIVDTSIKSKSFNLDVDGDGKITALGDGLMVIRKLFGAAFAGDALTNKAMSPTSTRTSAEIHQFIQQGITTGLLDVDKDGKTTALGDGLMVIRHLFGAAFAGAALTNKAISPDSPYFGPPANFAAVAANIDAMRPV